MGFTVRPPCVRTSRAEFTVDGRRHRLRPCRGEGRRPAAGRLHRGSRRRTPTRASPTSRTGSTPRSPPSARWTPWSAPARSTVSAPTGRRCRAGSTRSWASQTASRALRRWARTTSSAAPRRRTCACPSTRRGPRAERLKREHDAIGFYLSAHPLDDYADALRAANVPRWRDFAQQVKIGAGTPARRRRHLAAGAADQERQPHRDRPALRPVRPVRGGGVPGHAGGLPRPARPRRLRPPHRHRAGARRGAGGPHPERRAADQARRRRPALADGVHQPADRDRAHRQAARRSGRLRGDVRRDLALRQGDRRDASVRPRACPAPSPTPSAR